MGGGSTIAAAISVGYESIGVEVDPTFFNVSLEAIPALAALPGNGKASSRRIVYQNPRVVVRQGGPVLASLEDE